MDEANLEKSKKSIEQTLSDYKDKIDSQRNFFLYNDDKPYFERLSEYVNRVDSDNILEN